MTVNGGQSWFSDSLAGEARLVWEDLLEPVPSHLVSTHLSTPTRRFLTDVGLPTVPIRDITPLHDSRLLVTTHQEGREYVALAEGSEPSYCFAVELATDRVFYLDEIPRYSRLVNSNVGLFVLFLGKYHRHVLGLATVNQESLEAAVADVWQQLRIWDPEATDDRGWWDLTLEQIATEYE